MREAEHIQSVIARSENDEAISDLSEGGIAPLAMTSCASGK
jgi:hypothetical protein